MSVRDELRDPWGWLVAAVSGGLGWAVLGAGPPAVAAGLAVGAVVLGTKVLVGAARGGDEATRPELEQRRDRLPEIPRDSVQHALVVRARRAVDRLGDLAARPADPWVAEEAGRVLAESRAVLASLTDMAGRITLLDSSVAAARPDLLAQEMASLQRQMGRTTDAEVRREQDRALAALDAQADSIDRLLRRRETLLAQLQASTVGLESLATRTGELVALGPASHDTDEGARIVTDLTRSLDAVRAGIEEARNVLRDL